MSNSVFFEERLIKANIAPALWLIAKGEVHLVPETGKILSNVARHRVPSVMSSRNVVDSM